MSVAQIAQAKSIALAFGLKAGRTADQVLRFAADTRTSKSGGSAYRVGH